MKHFTKITTQTVVVMVVQLSAMIFFMRVVYLSLFLSAGLSALIALNVILVLRRRFAGHKSCN